jgi:soluble lytic murein transglycosylase
VTSLIRQESLFMPDAVSPATRTGLMQLLPRTARASRPDAGLAPADARALHAVPTNVRLGTTLLPPLLDKYDGSSAKALAAYNAGEDAVTKWEKRYGPTPDDEFTELISFRETRDYVKLVLRTCRSTRQLYARARRDEPRQPAECAVRHDDDDVARGRSSRAGSRGSPARRR